MKQLFHFLFVLVIVLCATVLVLIALSTLLAPKDPVLDALPRWESKEFYTSGGFQDSTDYAKYTYRIGKDQLEETGVLHPVKEDNIPDILAYVGNFEKWVRTCDDFPKDDYDFDKSRIGVGDYFFILNQFEESEKAFWNYNLYYFDVDAGILHYCHNTIQNTPQTGFSGLRRHFASTAARQEGRSAFSRLRRHCFLARPPA